MATTHPDASEGRARGRGRSAAVVLLGVAAAAVVLAGVVAQVWRPVAPPVDGVDVGRWFAAEHVRLAEAYWRPVHRAGLVALAVRLAVPCAVAFSAAGTRMVGAVLRRVGERRPARGAAVVAVGIVVATDLVLAPVAFWRGYLHEDLYGFRVQGVGGWARDWLVARAPGWVAVAVLVLSGYALARRLPTTWPLVAGLLAAALTVLVVWVSPVVLEPLRFSTTPLPDGPLREEVEALVQRAGLESDTLLVADASRRTIRHNAYVSGLGRTRRVVLYDTLVEERPLPEVAMVVAHELGHERNADLLRGTMTGAAGAVLAAIAVGGFLRWRTARGRRDSVADPRAVPAVVVLLVALGMLAMPVESALSRRAEAAADAVALQLTGDPATYTAMHMELARRNLSHPHPPRWARWLWSSHPTPVERLALAEQVDVDRGDPPAAGGSG